MTDGTFHRVLGRIDTFALAFGAMIGWSWVILAGTWVSEGGMAVIFILAAGALLIAGGFLSIGQHDGEIRLWGRDQHLTA